MSSLSMQLYFNGCFVFKVSDCDIDEMFTYADADCDGRIRYRPDSLIKYFPSHSFYLPSWSEFQTMIVPQPVGGVGVAGGGSWARAVPRHAPGPAPRTLSVSGLARVAPAVGNRTEMDISYKYLLSYSHPRRRTRRCGSGRSSPNLLGADELGPASRTVTRVTLTPAAL